jgi:hypothetical protein
VVDVPWWLWLAVAVLACLALDRLLLAAERRRWIYYRTTAPKRSTVAQAVQSIELIFAPDKRHVVEQRAAIDADQPGDDEPPRL